MKSLSGVAVVMFALRLLFSLSLALADVDAEWMRELSCQIPGSTQSSQCSRNTDLSGCKMCAGLSSCCLDTDSYFGSCSESDTFSCPNGDEAICRSGDCPPTLSCKFINCPENAEFCWGSTICDDKTICPHLDRLFCSGEKSNPKNFSVCCSSQMEDYMDDFKNSEGLTSAVSSDSVHSEDFVLISDGIEKMMLNSVSTAKDIRGQYLITFHLWNSRFHRSIFFF